MRAHSVLSSSLAIVLTLGGAATALVGCPESEADVTPAPGSTTPEASTDPPDASPPTTVTDAAPTVPKQTHEGIVSIQDIAIVDLPQAGHGLTVTALFNASRAPDFDPNPGKVEGCRGWSYDVAKEPPPAYEDHGTVKIDGIAGGALACRFDAARGYTCPTASGSGQVSATTASGPTATYTLSGMALGSADVGRYLVVSGAATAGNAGAFPIVAVPNATTAVVGNPRAQEETFTGTFAILAGAGPTPNDLYRPFAAGTKVTVGLTSSGKGVLRLPDVTLTPGEEFTLDDATRVKLTHVPLTGEALTVGCASCGKSDGTIVRITTTDADVTGLSPVAMPPATKRFVEISCVGLGDAPVTVPAAAMDLLRKAHAASPMTRIRTAFMRDGLTLHTPSAPNPPNHVFVGVGRGFLGFTTLSP